MKNVVLVVAAIALLCGSAYADTYTYGGGSLTTTDRNPWGGEATQYVGPGFNVDAGPVTIEFIGVNLGRINYTGDMGWPPDATDTGASAIVGLGNSSDQFVQYGIKSNMAGSQARPAGGTGKGSWDHQNVGHWNDDGYRSYLFQGQYTGNLTNTMGNSQYNAEKRGGPNGNNDDYDTFDVKMYIERIAANTYSITAWHVLWESSAIDEGCYWDWNYAKNAISPAKRGYLKVYEGTWTADGGLDLSNVRPYLSIQNWGTDQPEAHTFDWDSIIVTGTVVPEPSSTMALVAGLGSLLAFRRRRA